MQIPSAQEEKAPKALRLLGCLRDLETAPSDQAEVLEGKGRGKGLGVARALSSMFILLHDFALGPSGDVASASVGFFFFFFFFKGGIGTSLGHKTFESLEWPS